MMLSRSAGAAVTRTEGAMTERLPGSGDYDPSDDMRRSIEFAYQHVRERVACGGHGWRDWPEPPALDLIHSADGNAGGSAAALDLTREGAR
jgi:hypothetical protein